MRIKRLHSRAYSVIYRLRKDNKKITINTSQRTLFFDINSPEDINESKLAIRLLKEFNFAAQSELRS